MALGPLLPAALSLTHSPRRLCLRWDWPPRGLTASSDIQHLRATHDDHVPMSLWSAWRFRPALGWAAVVGGVFEVGLGSITTAYGSQIGLNLAKATSIAGAFGMGSFLLQYPVGWLADHWPARRLFVLGGLLLLASGVAFIEAAQAPWLIWFCAATWGAVGGALYTLSMIRVAHDFADSSALAAPRP